MTSRPWQSWSGLVTARPAQVLAPASESEVVDAVEAARASGLPVKMVGSGHSFTDIALTPGVMLLPDRLSGLTAVDRDAMTVSVLAGTPLHVLNARLAELGLALHNLGDIDRQTVAGAISTGTHGSGGVWSSLSAQVTALTLVTGEGSVVRASETERPDLLEAARVGLGALGVLTEVTFRVEPAFRLEAVEEPMTWDRFTRSFEEMVADNHHVDIHWFPGTDRALVKRNNRTIDEPRPLSPARAWVDDELLANRVFGGLTRVGELLPRAVPALNQVASRGLGARSYVDSAHRVFVSSRKVRFREMEYAVPREAGMAALAEARSLMERTRWPVSIPVEIRAGVADDTWLSPSYRMDTVYLAFHVSARTDHTGCFTAVERVMRAHRGRPHWGKLHSRTAADLAPDYPRFADFLALRDRLDPDRLFGNRYLERVLGPGE